jgi:UDP-2,3-diacylglucosamine pyrophosphatase LpxH
MLIIVSDIHLGDGTCGRTISENAFHLFSDRLRELAYNASWRTDGGYRPLKEIDVLMLGDIFDFQHSTLWLEKADGEAQRTRPWSDPNTPEYAQTLQAITRAILANNAGSVRVFKNMTAGKAITLPPANLSGRPTRFALVRQPVKVNLYYMVGNHDWYFHLPGPAFDAVRAEIIQALGLANEPGPFPHEVKDSPKLQALLDEYEVHAQHGDLYDRFNYLPEKGRNAASIGDVFAVELLNRFPLEVERQLKNDLPAGFTDSLRMLVNIRPSLAAPLWISSHLRQNNVSPQVQKRLKALWNQLAEECLSTPYLRSLNRKNKLDLIDSLNAVVRLTSRFSFKTIDDLVLWARKNFGSAQGSFASHALTEEAFLNRRARFIVYGHTHHHEVVPLDTSPEGTKAGSQLYMNSGTWHTYYDLAIHQPREQKFIPYQVLTYLTFYQGDERGGRRFETWSGSFSD